MIGSLATALKFNAAEIKECNSKVSALDEKAEAMQKENAAIKERLCDSERYSRCWNLRVKGKKAPENKNTRKK